MSTNLDQVATELQENSNDNDEIKVFSYQNLVELAGDTFQERISKEVDNFTEQVTLVNNSASLTVLSDPESRQQTSTLRTHYLEISADGFRSTVKEELQGFTEHVMSIRREESAFNERAKLLLQCHTMSAFITNCLMEKLEKKKQESSHRKLK